MAEAVVTEPYSAPAPAQLAARHGLRVAGERPALTDYVRRLWAYRHFILAFANAKNVATLTTARLGQLWHVLTPLTNAAVYYLIFGLILNTSRGIENFPAYLCAGIFIFGYTTQVVTGGTGAISGNLGMIRALQFPRASLPLSVTITQLQQLLAAMLVLMGIVLITGEPLTFNWLTLIPLLLLQTVFNAGLAMLVARAGSKITDLKQIMPFLLRTWLYGSGVFFNLAAATDGLPKWASTLLQLNPMSVFIELGREALLVNTPAPGISVLSMWLVALVWAVVVGIGGFVYFWRGEKEYGRG
ncbi:ABC transporter permease [Catellatospora citrea]|uniref:Transport permease protein n=1 Tax=Catellatospora citrea TaxID=53366 RepID=A0A8J3NYY0_9ACTN|nr:ABC transporter permease [Catellatospora citrea]RKE09271.1 teichoic acid transport system permease protein [Catellatospora citrea]GIF97226.1 transport permease protein [Catellatospora citrea]